MSKKPATKPATPSATEPPPEIVPASEGPAQAQQPAQQFVAMDRRAWDAIDAFIGRAEYRHAAPLIQLINQTGGVRPVSVSGA